MVFDRFISHGLASPCTNESRVHSFTGQPAIGNSNPINISIIDNLGNTNAAIETIGALVDAAIETIGALVDAAIETIGALVDAANNTDLFLHVGDISYADDHDPDSVKA